MAEQKKIHFYHVFFGFQELLERRVKAGFEVQDWLLEFKCRLGEV